jgi:coenzyme PQQ synthesis protein D (PqqD)
MKARLRVNAPRVMHERIEGEVIVIDLTTGSYFSLRDVGSEIWAEIERGATEQEIVAVLEERYEASQNEIDNAVRRVVGELADEGLIRSVGASGEGSPGSTASAPSGKSNGSKSRRAFSAPVLEKHTDMQDLILLDPVHEVDARGWPHAAEDDADSG